MDLYYLFSVALYSLLNYLPYLVLILIPFEDFLRFSKRTTILLIIVACTLQIATGIWVATFDTGKIASILSIAVNLFFILLNIKAQPGKLVFLLLMVICYADLVVIAAKFLESLLFPAQFAITYHITFSLTTTITLILSYPFILYYFKKRMAPVMGYEGHQDSWRYLWLVPSTFFLFYYYLVFANPAANSFLGSTTSFIFILLINIGMLFTFELIVRMLKDEQHNLALIQENQLLAAQSRQNEVMLERVEQATQLRHDIRHHINATMAFLDQKDLEGLRHYMADYQETIPKPITTRFCHHNTANAFLVYYAAQCAEQGIPFSVTEDIPVALPISESDLGALIGNLLENALEAMLRDLSLEGGIAFSAQLMNGSLAILVDNPTATLPTYTRDGSIHSTKHHGPGIGTASICHIVKRYNGDCRFEVVDGFFRASVRLPILPAPPSA